MEMTAKYLSSFLDYVIRRESDPFEFDVDSAKVYVEYNIGNISADYTTGGRIDLMVQDKNKQTIIVLPNIRQVVEHWLLRHPERAA